MLARRITGESKNPFNFEVSDDLLEAPKLVKTHQFEIFLKSDKNKGLNVGLTIDPVKIESVEQFASPSELAKRVLAVEQGKEGYIEGEVLSAQKSTLSSTATLDSESLPLTVYDLDYKIETTRGLNHFLVRTAVANKHLYVLTTQCKESSYENLSPLMHEVASSLTIP